ncbi:MAG: HpcH/HpaI aldolase family protein [Methyloligellaceae bacterium]
MSDTRNRFRERLLSGETLIGLWCSLGSPMVAEILSLADYDWILLDTEHSPNEPRDLLTQLQALQGCASEPIVRPAWNDPVLIKRVMDVGVKSLIVPFVQTKEEAEAAVRASRYPPDGIRGIAAGTRASRYGTDEAYWRTINGQVAVVVQVESQQTLDNLDAICEVPEVDCLFVGPNDLAASLGLIRQIDARPVQEGIARVVETCRAKGKAAGILATSAEETRRYLDMGFTLVGAGADIAVLRNGAVALREQFRQ